MTNPSERNDQIRELGRLLREIDTDLGFAVSTDSDWWPVYARYLYARGVRVTDSVTDATDGNLAEQKPDDELQELPPTCPTCGEPFQLVRPGKWQEGCKCWQTCPIHGLGSIQYHGPGVVPQTSGYFCLKCENGEQRE